MWDILGLDEPSLDLRVIKKAYAKKLRLTRPDEYPTGFMALREALEHAKNFVHYQTQKSDYEWIETEADISIDDATTPESVTTAETSVSETHADETETRPAVDYLLIDADKVVTETYNPKCQLENVSSTPPEKTIMESIHALLKDPFGRANAARWVKIFEDPRLEGIDELIDFEDSFRSFLLTELGYYDGEAKQHNSNRNPKVISSQIGTLIFNHMGWRDIRGRPLYIQDQIEWLRIDLDVINKSKRPISDFSNQALIAEKQSNTSYAWTFVLAIFGLLAIARIMTQLF